MSSVTPSLDPNLPSIIIVHLIRHAQSKGEGPKNSALSFRGQLQCDELSQTFKKHAPYVTHILSSPIDRCLETARRSFSRHLKPGQMIQVMPALAGGGRGTFARGSERSYPEVDQTWIEEKPGPRESRMRDEEFVMRYFTLQGLDKKDAQKVREVVVVTHMVLLSDLLADAYHDRDFANAKMRSYFVRTGSDSSKTLVHLNGEEKVVESRKAQRDQLTKMAHKNTLRNVLLKVDILQEKVETEKAKMAAKKKPAKERAAREVAEAAAIEEIKKANILGKQDKMEVVDAETNRIMTLGKLLALLKIRHRKEFLSEQRMSKENRRTVTLKKRKAVEELQVLPKEGWKRVAGKP